MLDSSSFSNESKSPMQYVPSDRRMFHLNRSLRDRVEASNFLDDMGIDKEKQNGSTHHYNDRGKRTHRNGDSNKMQLLPHPRIVNATPHSNQRYGRSEGISCMDLDRGHNDSRPNSPSRYLLVGSGGNDCSIALYDLSYFGSDEGLSQKSCSSTVSNGFAQNNLPLAAVTHRPIARSVRHNEDTIQDTINIGGVPSGHRQPLLGVHWYPADHGSFVSASISGEILVWDAESFVPVFATTTHVYGGHSNVGEVRKSVAPLQCVDLPKDPNTCPHGKALLALGLGGGDGRSVIQLCDAFRGGSATHELVGHNGGVNAVSWDPNHPFRLASGGEDCTVRLWDIRKAGRKACLGVLDRDNGYSDAHVDNSCETSKRHCLTLNTSCRIGGIESHDGPVLAVAFAPGGEELVSSGFDGSLHLWDLRPDSCCVSSIAATIGKRKWDVEKGGMDPSVACGGRLYPYMFRMKGNANPKKRRRPTSVSRRDKISSLAIVQRGTRMTTTLFATNSSSCSKSQVAVYSLFKNKEQSNKPISILNGHLSDISCLTPVVGIWDNLGVRCGKYNNKVGLLSAGKDGMILSWGIPAKDHTSERLLHSGINDRMNDRSNAILSILKQQRQHRLDRLNRQYQNGIISGREWHDSVYEHNNHSQSDSIDIDSW